LDRDYTYTERATGGHRGGSWDSASELGSFIEKSGLGWDVRKQDTYGEVQVPDGVRVVKARGQEVYRVEHTPFEASKVIALGQVSEGYGVYQNREVLQILEQVCDQSGAEFLKGGYWDDGRKCWAQARMPETLKVLQSDELESLFTLTWGHGGASSITASAFLKRLNCLNLMPALNRERKGNLFLKVRHSRNVRDYVNRAVVSLKHTAEKFREFGELADLLANKRFTRHQFAGLVEAVQGEGKHNDDVSGRTRNIRAEVMSCWDHPKVVAGRSRSWETENTGWHAWNAITQYTTHERSTAGTEEDDRQGNRLQAVLAGRSASGFKLIDQSLDLILAA
jgi:phage/plasmid-like protein (TIGR03299 family)